MQSSKLIRVVSRNVLLAACGVLPAFFAGCQTLTHTENGALFGSGLGAATGAVIGHQSGHTAGGAAIGAVAGALTGAVVGNAQDERDAAIAQAQASQMAAALTNYDLIRMAQSGLGDEVIINAMQTRGGRFDLSVDALIQLRDAGVSDRVITSVQQASAAAPRVAATSYRSSSVVVAPPVGVVVGGPAVVVAPRPVFFGPRRFYRWRRGW
ncbi:MAG: glycine zipper domain-containing protein [Planctomycetaceae bacterium]